MTAIQRNSSRWFQRTGLKVPDEGREQPRPAEHVATLERLYQHGRIRPLTRLQRDAPAFNQVELVRRLTFANDFLACLELSCFRPLGQNGEMLRFHPARERVVRDGLIQWFHSGDSGFCQPATSFPRTSLWQSTQLMVMRT